MCSRPSPRQRGARCRGTRRPARRSPQDSSNIRPSSVGSRPTVSPPPALDSSSNGGRSAVPHSAAAVSCARNTASRTRGRAVSKPSPRWEPTWVTTPAAPVRAANAKDSAKRLGRTVAEGGVGAGEVDQVDGVHEKEQSMLSERAPEGFELLVGVGVPAPLTGIAGEHLHDLGSDIGGAFHRVQQAPGGGDLRPDAGKGDRLMGAPTSWTT